eukprot:scaffold76021_cov62-Phaeocystis_antarctica.AAC.2
MAAWPATQITNTRLLQPFTAVGVIEPLSETHIINRWDAEYNNNFLGKFVITSCSQPPSEYKQFVSRFAWTTYDHSCDVASSGPRRSVAVRRHPILTGIRNGHPILT